MKPDRAARHAPVRAGQPRVDGRETAWLVLLRTMAAAAVLLFWPPPRPLAAEVAGVLGGGVLLILVGRTLLRFAHTYELAIGLRILGRDHAGRHGWVWVGVCLALVVGGIGGLALGHKSVLLVGAVAAGTFFGLLALLAMRFSVFGTTSIVGVVLGVAALVVVQSVATGFQHEFERRVLGVYAHINVTRALGIAEYRRFEQYLRTVPGVAGASPFVYYPMAFAPWDPELGTMDDLRTATGLVKGIEPTTASEVIDLPAHLERGSGRSIPLDALVGTAELAPVADREPELLPEVIRNTPDPRGPDWYGPALEHYEKLPQQRIRQPAATEEEGWAEETERPLEWEKQQLPTLFMGLKLAHRLGVKEGSVVVLVDPGAGFDASETPRFQRYRVAGLFEAGFDEYDSQLVYVHIKELQHFKYDGRDLVSGIDLRLNDADLASQVGARIKQALGEHEYSVLEWQILNESLFQSIRTQKNIITIILSLVVTVATFNVLSALWTMVVRRTAEVAILVSMGATAREIARIFQVTGMTIGLAGSLAGIGFGLTLCWLVELYGYSLDPEVYFIARLPVEISAVQIGAILAMTLVICFAATLPPSLRAAKLRPVEGLRYE